MPFKSHIDGETNLIVHDAEGPLIAEELLAAFDIVTSDPLYRPELNVLWDLTDCIIEGGSSGLAPR